MPKSRKHREVTLTSTVPQGKEGKNQLIETIRDTLEHYSYVYVFEVHNMRTNFLKDIRVQYKTSRFFLGKNKVLQVALGRDVESEQKPKLHKVAQKISGNCGLMFTNEAPTTVLEFFQSYRELDYARAGFEATQDVVLPEGPLPQFQHSMEPFLRGLGMPTKLNKGVIELITEFQVCKVGDELTPEQAKILKQLDIKMSDFYLDVVCVWSPGKFKDFRKEPKESK
eukprot:TRINITY_DN20348_c0_g1_i1.p1 TRINITY_DN20348_c0_g1~~TRINITY_DN20348_c0_g1_i1.p1  ORF type:complete len:225 (-),score=45.66 TRINITY_DN20348_c0_g1_i1:22-696(-)